MTNRTGVPGHARTGSARPRGAPSPARPTGTRLVAPTRLRTAGDDLNWTPAAACQDTDPELFFPIGQSGRSRQRTTSAKAVCQHCPVIESCRAWALTYPKLAEYGVWGGLTEDERGTLQRRRHRATGRVA